MQTEDMKPSKAYSQLTKQAAACILAFAHPQGILWMLICLVFGSQDADVPGLRSCMHVYLLWLQGCSRHACIHPCSLSYAPEIRPTNAVI